MPKNRSIAMALVVFFPILSYGCLFSFQEDAMAHEKHQPNHLINEKSPYLLQHAYNPVDWRPWGKEALEKARKENKPILLSIGYSTCHWCHVMEKESFEDHRTAEIMNRHFVSIKVDREERPDIDKLYITAVSALSGSAGWPLNVFLTPDLKPFFGGTYFPPEPRWGSPSWPDLLNLIAEAWNDPGNHQKLLSSADDLTERLRGFLSENADVSAADAPIDPGFLKTAFETLSRNYDKKLGGFSGPPKFPMPSNQNFLFFFHDFVKYEKDTAARAREAIQMAAHTLKAMADGGMYDQIGGGFHRYSTDAKWHVPHFEKMLYDNAQLIANYLDAFQITHDPFYSKNVRQTIEYIRRDMTHPNGGFYSAEDADSRPPGTLEDHKKAEGAFYVWEQKELEEVLGSEISQMFCYRYGIKPGGNAENDPHKEFVGKNILYVARSIDETAEKFKRPAKEVEQIMDEARLKLLDVRSRRPRPHLDDKILTSWNGLMISALAKAYQVLGDKSCLDAAIRAAEFIRNHLYDKETKILYRRWREGERKIPGMASDYAFFTQGLIDLYEADFDPGWLDWAMALATEQIRLFYDAENGGFFMTRSDKNSGLIMRIKEDTDNAIPSAGSVACLNLIRLSSLSDRPEFPKAAEKSLKAVQSKLRPDPSAGPQALVAFGSYLKKPPQVIIAGDGDDERTKVLLKTVRSVFIPGRSVILVDGNGSREKLTRHLPFINFVKAVNGVPTAYMCVNQTCKAPVTSPEALLKLITSPESGNLEVEKGL
jgi:uncharacterized protein YyaL (SSP411 family)